MLLVQANRRQLRLAEVRATAQASLGGEEAEQAFKDYASLLRSVDREAQSNRMRAAMDRWIQRGPLVVTSLLAKT